MSSVTGGARRIGLTAAESFWYVLGCIAFGAAYFSKIPVKKALADFGLAKLTGAESFWYILMCIAFGAGYFAKIPAAKAISELEQYRSGRAAPHARLEDTQRPQAPPPDQPQALPPDQPHALPPEER